MNPASLMAISGVISSLIGGLTGNQGETGSTRNKGQLGLISDAINSIKGMKGSQDITQNQGYQQGQEWLNNLFGNDQGFWNQFEAPLQRQFQEQTVPELANRFASMGSGGSTGSTAFRNQLGREGSNLSTNIAALRGGMQQQGVNQQLGYAQQPFQNLMQLYQQALQPTQNTYQGPTGGFFGNIAAPLISGAANIWGNQAGQQAGMNNPFGGNPLTGATGRVSGQYPGTS